MLRSLRAALKARRNRTSTAARRAATSRRPSVETMEGRQLLTSLPFLTVSSPKVAESTGPVTMGFQVSLSNPSTTTVAVSYKTANNTAAAGVNYTATSGTILLAPGQTSATIPVSLLYDSTLTANKSFYLDITSAPGVTDLTPSSLGVISPPLNPTLSIPDVTMTRGLSGTKTMVFNVSLAVASSTPVTVTATTSDLTATAGVDYQAKTQVLTFAPGQTTAQFAVTIYGSPATTGTEKFFLVNLSGASVPITRAQAAGGLLPGA